MRPLVIGVGNPDRGDDGVGRVIAQRLGKLSLPDVDIDEASGEAAALLSLLQGREMVMIVDACQSNGAAGHVRQFDVSAAPLPSPVRAISSHGFGVPEAIELARTLGELPARTLVIAVEGQAFELGASLSPEVHDAVETAIDLICTTLHGGTVERKAV